MSDIKEGKLKIICKDGLAQNTQIITPRGDLIYASKVVIEIKPPGLCTATITIKGVDVEMYLQPEGVTIQGA